MKVNHCSAGLYFMVRSAALAIILACSVTACSTKNGVQTVDELRKAAEQGYAYAQNDLGAMYYNGQGVARDYSQALTLFRKAAEQGYAYAQNNLGAMYYNGRGVAKDYSQAITWFRKAAEQGHAGAIKNVKLAKYEIEMAEKKKYLESPEGKEETRKAEAKAKAEDNRIMLICDDFGRDIAKKYNFGKYSGTLSRKHLHEDLYYCVAIFKQETVTGFMMPNYKGITINNRTGVYEIEYLN
jgi:hypothetical protein